MPKDPVSAHDSAHGEISAHMSREQWFQGLRRQIKHSCGPGWGIAERNRDCQLTRRFNEGRQHGNPRQSVMLGTEWSATDSAAILTAVFRVKELVDSRHCSLAEAKATWRSKEAVPASAAKPISGKFIQDAGLINAFKSKGRARISKF